jgi:putative ABC transport system permease protein
MTPSFMVTEAWRALGANRLRTLLTMLGMIIGVAAVILMLAVGSGAQFRVSQAISALGSNLFIILSGSQTSGGVRTATGSAPTLTLDDAAAIGQLSNIAAVAPIAPGGAQIVYGANNWSTGVTGTTPGYLEAHNWPLAVGRMFTEGEIRGEARVAVIGQTVATNLFGSENPVGKTVRIANRPFEVIGLLSVKGQSLNGQDQDDTVLIPVSTALHQLFGSTFANSVRFIMAQAVSPQAMNQAQTDMDALLRQRHHLQPAQPDDFSIRNLTALTNAASDTTRIMSLLLGAIASISLIVGGIGIMNIMLVSVTERTREIGIRVAVGARRRDILLQFLLEAIFISVSGCLFGVLLGVLAAAVLQGIADLTVIVTGISILLAFSVAAGIGVFFGFYPARKASLMKPIDALRYQ